MCVGLVLLLVLVFWVIYILVWMVGERNRTRPMASPRRKTMDWSAMDSGEVRRKKAMVIWKREREVMMVAPEMTPMLAVVACAYVLCSSDMGGRCSSSGG